MSNSVISTLPVTGDENRPLPLIVAEKWGFPLAYVETESEFYFAVQDWIKGLTGADDVRHIWANLQRREDMEQVLFSKQQLPYTASNGKTYQMDHVTDKGLYLIAQYLRVTKARPVLDEIKKFLAEAGAFVDDVRRNPDTILLSGAITPDQAMDAAIQAYRSQGKDDNWIRARMEGKIKRNLFTSALSAAVVDVLTRHHYASATDDVYRGLWNRTAAHLKSELELGKKDSLRDHQPMLALYYQGIAEEVAARKLGDREELTWSEARQIVQMVAAFIGKQAQDTSELLGLDLATGKPLLARR